MNKEQKEKFLVDLERDIETTKKKIDFANKANDLYESERLNNELTELEHLYFRYSN